MDKRREGDYSVFFVGTNGANQRALGIKVCDEGVSSPNVSKLSLNGQTKCPCKAFKQYHRHASLPRPQERGHH
jgi:hypothetical protein